MCIEPGSLVPLQEVSLVDIRGPARLGLGFGLHGAIIVDAKALSWPLPYSPFSLESA
jgi:hypothetical protein